MSTIFSVVCILVIVVCAALSLLAKQWGCGAILFTLAVTMASMELLEVWRQ